MNRFLKTITICAMFIASSNLYAQTFECDNNFGDCGTPQQSGGGGGGGGSVLIANTDLGDTYQHADDFDDDGVEDSKDNCMRVANPMQYNVDGDSFGDACDNCIYVYNPDQRNGDGDEYGDACDNDDDNDGIEDSEDFCPNQWGNLCQENQLSRDQPDYQYDYPVSDRYERPIEVIEDEEESYPNVMLSGNNCSVGNKTNFSFILLLILFIIKSREKMRDNT